jgi:hypothetical protein
MWKKLNDAANQAFISTDPHALYFGKQELSLASNLSCMQMANVFFLPLALHWRVWTLGSSLK